MRVFRKGQAKSRLPASPKREFINVLFKPFRIRDLEHRSMPSLLAKLRLAESRTRASIWRGLRLAEDARQLLESREAGVP